jgi:hypothetical protein
MMYGHEKSDPTIVATKPANKADQPAAERSAAEPTAAEPVERRAGTKGNAGQQSTHRTQSRANVSQALERIRKVARERKKERFTALFHHISSELLVLRTQGRRRAGCGSADMEGLRGRPRTQHRGFVSPGPAGSVSGTAVPARLHSQTGRPAPRRQPAGASARPRHRPRWKGNRDHTRPPKVAASVASSIPCLRRRPPRALAHGWRPLPSMAPRHRGGRTRFGAALRSLEPRE